MTGRRYDTGCDANAYRLELAQFVNDGVDLPSARYLEAEDGLNVI